MSDHPIRVGVGGQVVHDAGAQVRPAVQRRRRDPAGAADLERSLQAFLIRIEHRGIRALEGGRDVSEAHDRQLRIDDVPAFPVEPLGEVVRQVDVLLDQSGEPLRPRCFHDIQSLSARNRRVPSSENWYQCNGWSSGSQTR